MVVIFMITTFNAAIISTTMLVECYHQHHNAGGVLLSAPQCWWSVTISTTMLVECYHQHHNAGGVFSLAPQCWWSVIISTTMLVECYHQHHNAGGVLSLAPQCWWSVIISTTMLVNQRIKGWYVGLFDIVPKVAMYIKTIFMTTDICIFRSVVCQRAIKAHVTRGKMRLS